jgi:AcrR family transcriptional regulator
MEATMATEGRRYHHGNLREALVEAGLVLARAGGPDALGLREVTRAVGVTPNAAYRHFTDRAALVLAVALRAQERLAAAMVVRMDEAGREPEPARRAYLRLRALGLAYVGFAMAEPGLFQAAFVRQGESLDGGEPNPPSPSAAPPYQLLVTALDDLVAAGGLPPQHRADAEWACWSAVHGLSDLLLRGPLHLSDAATVEHLAGYVVDRAIDGVVAAGAGGPAKPSTPERATS